MAAMHDDKLSFEEIDQSVEKLRFLSNVSAPGRSVDLSGGLGCTAESARADVEQASTCLDSHPSHPYCERPVFLIR